jgi:hypothetical protein
LERKKEMAKTMTPTANSPRQSNEGDSRPSSTSGSRGDSESREMKLLNDVSRYVQDYARERPDVFAMWCFGAGFILGWRLKPW